MYTPTKLIMVSLHSAELSKSHMQNITLLCSTILYPLSVATSGFQKT